VLLSADIVSGGPSHRDKDGDTKISTEAIVANHRVNNSLTSHSLRDEDSGVLSFNMSRIVSSTALANHSPGVIEEIVLSPIHHD
jgi:hypothetical protein